MNDLVEVAIENGVATVTVNNPPVNSLGKPTLSAMGNVFEKLAVDPSVRSIVLTAKGDKAFLAGADISEFPDLMNDLGAMSAHMTWCRGVFDRICTMPQPVIAAVQANCVGGGLEVALLCDIIIADETAKFGLPETRLGLIPGGGGTQRLARLIGPHVAKQMLMLGSVISASEAHRLGIINDLAAVGEVGLMAGKLAHKLAGLPAIAVQAAKKAVDDGLALPLEKALDREQALFLETFSSSDFKEGLQAFLDKRKPQFTHQ